MKKKIVLVLLAALLCAGLFISCGGDDDPTYTITFDGNGGKFADGTSTTTKSVKKDAVITAPENPVLSAEKTFVKWTIGQDGSGAALTSTTKATGDAKYYAQYKDKEGSIDILKDFDKVPLGAFTAGVGNGTSQAGWASKGYQGAVSDVKVEDFLQAEYIWIEVKNKPAGTLQLVWQGNGTGVNPSGWFQSDILTNSGGDKEDLGTSVEDYEGGYAIKAELSLALGIKDTGGHSDAKVDTSYTKAKAGIKFVLGYYSTNLASLGEMNAYLLIPKGVIEAREYVKVTNDVTTDEVEVLKGYPLGAKFPANPTKADYVFDGWKVGDAVYTNLTEVTAAVELKAQWLEELTVTFDYRDTGKVNGTVKIGKGKTLTAAQIPSTVAANTEDGYAFGGWCTDELVTTSATTALAAPITASVTFYAKWLTPVTVTFDLNGGNIDGDTDNLELTIPYGTALGDKYPVPIKSLKEFGGWFDDDDEYADDTEITADITLTAKWNEVADFVVVLPVAAGKNQWDADTAYTHLQLQVAKFLVLDVTSVTGENGFGGLQLAIQGATPLGGWRDEMVTGGWNTCTNVALDSGSEDQFYIVIDLTTLKWASDVVNTASGWVQFFLNTEVPTAHLELNGAYLTNIAMVKPASDADDTSAGTVTSWAARTVPEIEDQL